MSEELSTDVRLELHVERMEWHRRQAFRTYLAAVVQGAIAYTGGFKTIEVRNMARGLVDIEEAEFGGAEEEEK